MVAEVFYFYAGAVDKHHGETIPVAGGVDLTFREPLGVVGLIVPWNFPLASRAGSSARRSPAGTRSSSSPRELTPLTAIRLGELALEAGIPEGVLNVVAGPGSVVGSRLVEHPDVAKIGFTGSTEVGRGVMEGAAGDDQARHPRARRASRRTSSSRTPTSSRCGRQRPTRSSATPDRTAARARASSSSAARTTASWSCSSRRPKRHARRRPGGCDDGDGPADLGGAPRDGRRPSSTANRCLPRRRSRGTGLLVPVHARRGDQRRSRRARGGVRPGRRRDPVRRRGRGGADRQRHAVRALRVGLDPRRRAGAASGARDRHRRPLRQLELRRCASRRRSAGSSSRASAASSACTRMDGYSEVKNVYIATEG